ncbi:MAG: 50S ribosomal protein L32 [Candidatus Aerophobetes bacterium]
MGVPKKKTSRSKRGHRQVRQKLSLFSLSHCPQCKAPKLPHFVCPECGYYKGKQVVKEVAKK